MRRGWFPSDAEGPRRLWCTGCVPSQPSIRSLEPLDDSAFSQLTSIIRKAAGQSLAQGVLCKQGVGGSSPLVSTGCPPR